ncbi:FHA domain-containing protein [Ruicaihuangia caeni]|uniref:FHA domain-containing protein n=1 Tax=Ruicaihuangia caeni TaxID=3042517 RepID=UPI00338F1E48
MSAHIVRYHAAAPGRWLAVVTDGRAAVVHTGADAQLAGDLATALAGGLPTALDRLLRDGIASLPSFALLEWTPDSDGTLEVHGLLRGEAIVELAGASGDSEWEASGVTTWLEQRTAGVTSLRIDVPDDADAMALPLGAGAVWVSRLTVSERGSAASATKTSGAAAAHNAGSARAATEVGPTVRLAVPAAQAAVAPLEQTIADLSDTAMLDERRGFGAQTAYDHLFDATIVRTIEEAAVRADDAEAAPGGGHPDALEAGALAATAEPQAGDHDGLTITTADLAAMRGNRAEASTPRASAAPTPSHQYFLKLSTGAEHDLDRPVLVGRAPSVSQVPGGSLPTLLALSGEPDVSRNHARFDVEGDTVLVTDLHSRNGTAVTLPGKAPQLIRKGEPTPVVTGAVIDFGGGTTITVCER